MATYKNLRERQISYVLSDDWAGQYGIFLHAQAMESLRNSRYSTTSHAALEIVDNGLQAEAKHIWVIFETQRNIVKSISFIDDGLGMFVGSEEGTSIDFLAYALMLGGSTNTREGDDDSIGKFGLGLPMSSINQTRRVEVYSKVSGDSPIYSNYLDLDELKKTPRFVESYESSLPNYVQTYLDKNKLSFRHGTVVSWVAPDNLSYKRTSLLTEQMLEQFGVTYRYLISNPTKPVEIRVNHELVEAIDPLFTTTGLLGYESPLPESQIEEKTGGGSRIVSIKNIAIERSLDEVTGQSFKYVEDPLSKNYKPTPKSSIEYVTTKVARMPKGFVLDSGGGIEQRRFNIREKRRGISFVRSGREIDTSTNWPRGKRAQSNGMGNFPLAQSYAYHWGVEVSFNPSLDSLFGISSDKVGIVPTEDLWRILARGGLDTDMQIEQKFQRDARRTITPDPPVDDGLPTPAEKALRAALASLSPSGLHTPDYLRDAANKNFEEFLGTLEQHNDGATESEIRDKALQFVKQLPFRVYLEALVENVVFKPEWLGGSIKIIVNTNHIFYRKFYRELENLGDPDLITAFKFFLAGLSQAELEQFDEKNNLLIKGVRTQTVSPLLDFSLRHYEADVEKSVGPKDETSE
tara:strand:- start:1367 stop:3265 length:1899 start_codon:yes stop_codon:yes gene_type:complete